jgi:hypothetical protein
VVQPDAVEVVIGKHGGLVKAGGALQFPGGELGGGAGLGGAGFKGGEFGRALALLQVGQPGLGLTQPFGGFVERGEFGSLLEAEERGASLDAGAPGHGELFQLAGEGSGHVDELAFQVTLVDGAGGPLAAGGGEDDEPEEDFSGQIVFHVLCGRRG